MSGSIYRMPGCGDPEATSYTIHLSTRRWRWLPWPKQQLNMTKDETTWAEADGWAQQFAEAGAAVEVHPFDCEGYDLYLGAPDTPENFPERWAQKNAAPGLCTASSDDEKTGAA